MATTFTLNVPRLRAAAAHLVRPLVEAGAIIARDEVVNVMDPGPARSGRVYKIPGTDVSYTASGPGEPPAVREGTYRDSWQASAAVENGGRVSARAFTALRVGRYTLGELLEFGTSRMAPRPHVRPALDIASGRLASLIDQANAQAG